LHTAFFIFLVSNLGGRLTPIGPPLFSWLSQRRAVLVDDSALLAGLVGRAAQSAFLIFYLVDRTYIGNSPNFIIKAIAE